MITKGNMSCIPFDIQRLKLDVAKSHYANASITYNYLVFPTNLGNIYYENYLLERKTNLGHKCKHKHFIQRLSTNCMGKLFFILNKPIFSRNIFYYIWSFWKGYLVAKKWQFHNYMYMINNFAIIEWFAFTCFFNAVIPFVVLYMIRCFFAWILRL